MAAPINQKAPSPKAIIESDMSNYPKVYLCKRRAFMSEIETTKEENDVNALIATTNFLVMWY